MATNRWISTGSNDWGATANWSLGSVPAAGEDVVIEKNAIDITGSLAQGTVALASLTIHQSYTGKIGSATDYLVIEASTVEIGRDDEGLNPPGSTRLNINLDSGTASQIHILNSAQGGADAGYTPIRLKIVNAAADLYVRKGLVSLAGFTGEVSTVDDVFVGGDESTPENTRVILGSGVTMDDLQVRGGTCTARCAVDAATIYGGATFRTEGSGAIATLNARGSGTRVIANSTGTITACNVSTGATLDTFQSQAARTITTLTIYSPANVNLNPQVTVTTLTMNTETPKRIVVT